jgi:hypothetical protein
MNVKVPPPSMGIGMPVTIVASAVSRQLWPSSSDGSC